MSSEVRIVVVDAHSLVEGIEDWDIVAGLGARGPSQQGRTDYSKYCQSHINLIWFLGGIPNLRYALHRSPANKAKLAGLAALHARLIDYPYTHLMSQEDECIPLSSDP